MLRSSQGLIAIFFGLSLAACGGGGNSPSAQPLAANAQNQNVNAAPIDQPVPVNSSGQDTFPATPTTSAPDPTNTGSDQPEAKPTPSKALAARFIEPRAIAAGPDGSLYVADRGMIRKISVSGEVSTIAGNPQNIGAFDDSDDGVGTNARFDEVADMSVDATGNLYVADTILINGRIRKISGGGKVTTVLHDVLAGGITTDAAGTVYFTTQNPRYIGYFAADGTVKRVIDPSSQQYDAGGTLFPHGIVVDRSRNLYVVGEGGIRPSPGAGSGMGCSIEKIAPDGMVTTLAGKRQSTAMENTCGSVDGKGAAAQIRARHLTIDSAGNLYIADLTSIRKVAPDGTVSTLAGLSSTPGRDKAADGVGAAARFTNANAITIDKAGNLYVTDMSDFTIRKISVGGTVTTIAGKSGESGYVDVP